MYPYHIRPSFLCNILDVCRRTKALDQCHSLGYDHNPKSLKIVAKNPQHNDEWFIENGSMMVAIREAHSDHLVLIAHTME